MNLIHNNKWCHMCDMFTFSFITMNDVTCVTCSHSYAMNENMFDIFSFIHVTWCDITHSYVCNTCDMTHSYVCNICEWSCHMTRHMDLTCSRSYMWHDHSHVLHDTRLVHMCHMTHSYMWRESFTFWHDSLIWVTWFIHMCDMPRSCV